MALSCKEEDMALEVAVVAVVVLDLWHCGSDAVEVVGGDMRVC